MIVEIEKTEDGSPTLYRPDIDEHYHSVKGAEAESLHVYLELGWRRAAESCSPVRVFEVGFGTGLNAALTARAALEEKIPTVYFSIELYPLANEIIEELIPCIDKAYRDELAAVNKAEWETPVGVNPYFTLIKMHADLRTMTLPAELNAVYFDAFAPEKQPEMWTEDIFRKIYEAMSPGGLIATYCAKGCIRRMWKEIGLEPERLPGPPGGKREVLRGIKRIG